MAQRESELRATFAGDRTSASTNSLLSSLPPSWPPSAGHAAGRSGATEISSPTLELPPLEAWEKRLLWLLPEQRERVESPEFYQLLQTHITRRYLALKPKGP